MFFDEYLIKELKNRIPTYQTCELNSREDSLLLEVDNFYNNN